MTWSLCLGGAFGTKILFKNLLRQSHSWQEELTLSTLNFKNMTQAPQSGQREETCRICLESSPIANSNLDSVSRFTNVVDEDRLISPCACSGTYSLIRNSKACHIWLFVFLDLCYVQANVCFNSVFDSFSHILVFSFFLTPIIWVFIIPCSVIFSFYS